LTDTVIARRRPSLSRLIRQSHRWISVIFTLSVVFVAIAMSQPEPVIWISYVPLLPLALLALSGFYLFALPYFSRRGRA
jgi:hypothetical protein